MVAAPSSVCDLSESGHDTLDRCVDIGTSDEPSSSCLWLHYIEHVLRIDRRRCVIKKAVICLVKFQQKRGIGT
jgi:hypothetical protein